MTTRHSDRDCAGTGAQEDALIRLIFSGATSKSSARTDFVAERSSERPVLNAEGSKFLNAASKRIPGIQFPGQAEGCRGFVYSGTNRARIARNNPVWQACGQGGAIKVNLLPPSTPVGTRIETLPCENGSSITPGTSRFRLPCFFLYSCHQGGSIRGKFTAARRPSRHPTGRAASHHRYFR